MRIIRDLLAIFISELLMFVMMICGAIGAGVLFLIYLASGLLFFVSLASGIIFWFTHSPHMLTLAVVYFGYSAVAFAIPMVLVHIPQTISKAVERRRQEKLSLDRIGGLRVASDASFHDCAH